VIVIEPEEPPELEPLLIATSPDITEAPPLTMFTLPDS
jgi:hypothetical protein